MWWLFGSGMSPHFRQRYRVIFSACVSASMALTMFHVKPDSFPKRGPAKAAFFIFVTSHCACASP